MTLYINDRTILAAIFSLTATIFSIFAFAEDMTNPQNQHSGVSSKVIVSDETEAIQYPEVNYIYPVEIETTNSTDLESLPSIWPRLIDGFRIPDIQHGNEITHRVKRGDTLSGISHRYGVTIKSLKRSNRLSGSLIRIGQNLVIHKSGQGKRVQKFERSYKNNLPYLTRIFERSQKYIHYILGEVEKRNMPSELALLPMIESAYVPVAYSRAHAAGLWQFIPSTGKNYGLAQNWWRDERRDVIASTKAALDYLQVLHAEFNDWQLVLAAYNWGENGLRRSIKRNKKRGMGSRYGDLRMPRETKNYVPKLQAIKNIVREANSGNISLPHVADYAYFSSVSTPNLIDIQLAAQFADIDIEEFEMLNASHNRPVFTSDGGTLMLIPSDRVSSFQENLKKHKMPLVNWGTYQFKKGDTLSQTAERFNIKLDKLRAINGLKPYVPIRIGQVILVPWADIKTPSNLSQTWLRPEFSQTSSLYGKEFVYRIKRGDTLSGIANRFGVSIKALKKWNNIKGSVIHIGKKLVIYKDLSIPRISEMLES